MLKNLIIITALFLFTSETVMGQERIYLNVDLTEITKEEYDTKKAHKLVHGFAHYSNGVFILKLEDKFSMGTLDSITNRQIRTLIHSDSGGYIPMNTPLYLHYQKDFSNHESQRQTRIAKLKEQSEILNYKIKRKDTIFSKRRHRELINYRKEQVKKVAKCAATVKVRSLGDVIFMYGEDHTNLITDKHPYFLKDRGIIQELLFKLYTDKYFIAIHPNGDYLMSYFLPDDKIVNLLNTTDWSEIRYDLIKSMKQNEPIGFFNFKRNIGACSHEN